MESDLEIDEDVSIEDADIPPLELDPEHTQDPTEVDITIWWIVTLLSLFQTQFYVTNRALTWLLNFLFVIFHYLGRYSAIIASLAQKFPQSFHHQYSSLMPMIMPKNSFHGQAVCRKCEAVYAFDECLTMVGSRTTVNHCKNKLFGKRDQLLMKEVITSNGTNKHYPHKVYCFISLISYLQLIMMRSGFVEQCESTRNIFSETGISDVYDGTLWKNFQSVENVPGNSIYFY